MARKIEPKPRHAKPDRRAGAILVLLTPAERENLRAAAERDGLGLGPWLRMLGILAARGAAAK